MNNHTYIPAPHDLILPDGTINQKWIVKVGPKPGNPYGGVYYTVDYILARTLFWQTLYGPSNPTAEDITKFNNGVLADALNTAFYTGDTIPDATAKAEAVTSHYKAWADEQNAPKATPAPIVLTPADLKPFGGKASGTILG